MGSERKRKNKWKMSAVSGIQEKTRRRATRKERKRSLIEEGKREREEKEKEERKGSEVIRKNRESTKKQRKFRIVITRGNMFIFLSYYISFVGSLASFFYSFFY